MPGRTPDEPMPPPTRLKVLGPEPPSLCRQGPCANYHELRLRMDAATPMDGSDAPMHSQLTRACYPTAGIEIELDDAPVFQCSRWTPDSSLESMREASRMHFMESDAGLKYQRELADWTAEQKRIAAEVQTYAETEYSPKTVLEQLAEQMDVGDVLQIRLRGFETTNILGSFMRTNDDEHDDQQLGRMKIAMLPGSYQLRVVGRDGETIKATSRYDHESTPAPKETV